MFKTRRTLANWSKHLRRSSMLSTLETQKCGRILESFKLAKRYYDEITALAS